MKMYQHCCDQCFLLVFKHERGSAGTFIRCGE